MKNKMSVIQSIIQATNILKVGTKSIMTKDKTINKKGKEANQLKKKMKILREETLKEKIETDMITMIGMTEEMMKIGINNQINIIKKVQSKNLMIEMDIRTI